MSSIKSHHCSFTSRLYISSSDERENISHNWICNRTADIVSIRRTACWLALATDPCVGTAPQEKPAYVHTGKAPEHEWCPVQADIKKFKNMNVYSVIITQTACEKNLFQTYFWGLQVIRKKRQLGWGWMFLRWVVERIRKVARLLKRIQVCVQ